MPRNTSDNAQAFWVNGRGQIMLQREVFNSLNHVNFDLPYNTVDSAQNGQIYSAEPSRQIQLGLKFIF